MGRRVSGPHAGVVTPNDVAVPDMGRRGEREQVRAGPVAKICIVLGRGGPPRTSTSRNVGIIGAGRG